MDKDMDIDKDMDRDMRRLVSIIPIRYSGRVKYNSCVKYNFFVFTAIFNHLKQHIFYFFAYSQQDVVLLNLRY
jgi:hypothetical protein